MRVLASALSCNASHGSEGLVGFKLVEALAQNHEVVVMSSPPSEVPGGANLRVCDAGPCSFNEVGAVPLLNFELKQQWLSRRMLARDRFDVVHRITPSAIQCPTLLHRLGRPLVVGPLIAADSVPVTFRVYLRRPISSGRDRLPGARRVLASVCGRSVGRLNRSRAHLEQASLILCGTRTARRHVPEVWRAKCFDMTYSGVELDVFTPPTTRPRRDRLRLLTVSRFVPYKGLELLLEAVALARATRDVQLDLVGRGDPIYQGFLKERASALGLTPYVKFLPQRSRTALAELYREADVFCFPTLCDTYGISLLEAMSSGCAVIASDVAGAGEIVDGTNGLKVRLDDPSTYIRDFADKIVALAQNRDLRLRLGDAARRYVLREHDWSGIGRQVRSAYEQLHIPETQ